MEYESYMQLYGKRILFDTNIATKRKIGTIKNYENFNIDILKEVLNECNLFDIDDYQYSIKLKHNKTNYEMNWHVDDACVAKTKKKDKINLQYNKSYEKPKYSLMIYETEYNKDFTGGELIFSDDLIIKPKCGLYVLFDSREVHKVNKVKSGIRNHILVKFY
jgi:hypothetical protein